MGESTLDIDSGVPTELTEELGRGLAVDSNLKKKYDHFIEGKMPAAITEIQFFHMIFLNQAKFY